MRDARNVLLLAAWLCAGLAMDLGTASADSWARARKPHFTEPKILHAKRPRIPRLRRPRQTYRSVSVRRADGTVLHGYRDSTGTHLTGPDGKMTHCQRSDGGVSDINVACR